jgi:hypothetical protein
MTSHHQSLMFPSRKLLVLFLLIAIAQALPLNELEAVEIRDHDILPRDAMELLPRETVSAQRTVGRDFHLIDFPQIEKRRFTGTGCPGRAAGPAACSNWELKGANLPTHTSLPL